eukprot:gene5763-4116_t
MSLSLLTVYIYIYIYIRITQSLLVNLNLSHTLYPVFPNPLSIHKHYTILHYGEVTNRPPSYYGELAAHATLHGGYIDERLHTLVFFRQDEHSSGGEPARHKLISPFFFSPLFLILFPQFLRADSGFIITTQNRKKNNNNKKEK